MNLLCLSLRKLAVLVECAAQHFRKAGLAPHRSIEKHCLALDAFAVGEHHMRQLPSLTFQAGHPILRQAYAVVCQVLDLLFAEPGCSVGAEHDVASPCAGS